MILWAIQSIQLCLYISHFSYVHSGLRCRPLLSQWYIYKVGLLLIHYITKQNKNLYILIRYFKWGCVWWPWPLTLALQHSSHTICTSYLFTAFIASLTVQACLVVARYFNICKTISIPYRKSTGIQSGDLTMTYSSIYQDVMSATDSVHGVNVSTQKDLLLCLSHNLSGSRAACAISRHRSACRGQWKIHAIGRVPVNSYMPPGRRLTDIWSV